MTVNLTHKNLQDWVKEIRENEEKMVTVLYNVGEKPLLLENGMLNGQDYLKSEDKLGYIVDNTDGGDYEELNLKREDILLPITSEVIDKVSEMEDSQAIARIERSIYDIVMEENEELTRKK